jgi:nitrite reductase/ring-hydroxylating ferredoxin subunit
MSRLHRRELIQRSFVAAVAPLCCVTPLVPESSVSFRGRTLLLDLNAEPDLLPAGSARAIVDAGRALNLIVARVDDSSFVALDRSCTHNGAQCTFNPRRRSVQCTSLNHAEYDLRGTLLHGRTHGNLRAYAARRNGSILEIDLESKS